MKALIHARLWEATSNTSMDTNRADDFGLFAALPLALGLGVLGWLGLAALAFGIYRLT